MFEHQSLRTAYGTYIVAVDKKKNVNIRDVSAVNLPYISPIMFTGKLFFTFQNVVFPVKLKATKTAFPE